MADQNPAYRQWMAAAAAQSLALLSSQTPGTPKQRAKKPAPIGKTNKRAATKAARKQRRQNHG